MFVSDITFAYRSNSKTETSKTPQGRILHQPNPDIMFTVVLEGKDLRLLNGLKRGEMHDVLIPFQNIVGVRSAKEVHYTFTPETRNRWFSTKDIDGMASELETALNNKLDQLNR